MVLDDDLIEIMDKNPEERTPEEQQAYLDYLRVVWATPTIGSKKKDDHHSAEET